MVRIFAKQMALKIEYTWGRKQNNDFDKLTNFIYSINNVFEEDPFGASLASMLVELKSIKALAGSTWNYVGLNDSQRLQEFLLQPEDPGLQFLEKFNSTAADLGICQDRRLQTRAMMTRQRS